ncbi:MAG: hypothetical protein AAB928_00410 [Patescibacteria group bacterium]
MSTTKIIIGLVIIAAAGFIGYAVYASQQPGELDAFARCLKDNGAIFYGAFWCPHCQTQKKMFGKSEKLLAYVECSTPDGRGQNQTCQNKNIEGYPTWEFADGSRLTGEIALGTLAEKTVCSLDSKL